MVGLSWSLKSLARLCHSCTLCGFWRSSTEFSCAHNTHDTRSDDASNDWPVSTKLNSDC